MTKKGYPGVVADASNAYFHAGQRELIYTQPPAAWLEARALQGLPTDVVWMLLKQLYGGGEASRGFY
eukprot:8860249-Alexandrium_andersonii.AAC.1